MGVDKAAADGVGHVVDVEREPLPFGDRTVETIFSAHCLEHLAEHALIFHEGDRDRVRRSPPDLARRSAARHDATAHLVAAA